MSSYGQMENHWELQHSAQACCPFLWLEISHMIFSCGCCIPTLSAETACAFFPSDNQAVHLFCTEASGALLLHQCVPYIQWVLGLSCQLLQDSAPCTWCIFQECVSCVLSFVPYLIVPCTIPDCRCPRAWISEWGWWCSLAIAFLLQSTVWGCDAGNLGSLGGIPHCPSASRHDTAPHNISVSKLDAHTLWCNSASLKNFRSLWIIFPESKLNASLRFAGNGYPLEIAFLVCF